MNAHCCRTLRSGRTHPLDATGAIDSSGQRASSALKSSCLNTGAWREEDPALRCDGLRCLCHAMIVALPEPKIQSPHRRVCSNAVPIVPRGAVTWLSGGRCLMPSVLLSLTSSIASEIYPLACTSSYNGVRNLHFRCVAHSLVLLADPRARRCTIGGTSQKTLVGLA